MNKEPFKDNYNSLLNICGLDGVEIKVWCPIIHEVCKTPDGKQSKYSAYLFFRMF